MGVAAKNHHNTNVNNTIYGFKSFLGAYNKRKSSAFNFFTTDENSEDVSLCYNVSYMNNIEQLSPQQITGALFAKIYADANAALDTERATSCVIAIPSFFSSSEQASVLIAAGIARLQCEYLIKETTAVAINYGFYKKFLNPVIVIFVDFGHESIQISACSFEDKKMEIIAECSEYIGGRDFDEILATHFLKKISVRNPQLSESFCVGLLNEVQKLKHKMSANTEKMTLNISHLITDNSVSLTMERSEMEAICQALFKRIENLMRHFLEDSKILLGDIGSIEIVGGSSRIPVFKKIIFDVFGKPPSNTMNQDEAIARGCLLRMSPKFKNYKIIEKEFPKQGVLGLNCLRVTDVWRKLY